MEKKEKKWGIFVPRREGAGGFILIRVYKVTPSYVEVKKVIKEEEKTRGNKFNIRDDGFLIGPFLLYFYLTEFDEINQRTLEVHPGVDDYTLKGEFPSGIFLNGRFKMVKKESYIVLERFYFLCNQRKRD